MSSSASTPKKPANPFPSAAPAKPASASVVALPIADQKRALAAAFGASASAERAAAPSQAAAVAPSPELLHLTAALGEEGSAANSRPRKERFLIALILPLAIVVGGLARDLTALTDRPTAIAEPRHAQPVTLDYPAAAAAAATGEPINTGSAPELALAQIAASLATLKPAAGPAQPREDVLKKLAATLPEPMAAAPAPAAAAPSSAAADAAPQAPRKVAVATPPADPAPAVAAPAPAAPVAASPAAAAKPAAHPAAPKQAAAPGGRFYVQFGAFRVEEYAREDCAAMAALAAVAVAPGSGANALMTCRTVSAMSEAEATALVARAHETLKHEAILVPEAKHAAARGGAVAAVDR